MRNFFLIIGVFLYHSLNSQLKIGKNPTTISVTSNLEVESNQNTFIVVTKDSGRIGIGTKTPFSGIEISKDYLTIDVNDTALQRLFYFRSSIAKDSVSDWILYKSDNKAIFSNGDFYPQGLHLYSYPKNGTSFGNCCNSRLSILDNGKIGIGTKNPRVKLDLREANQNNSLGLGTTSQSATEAGEGAIRYNSIEKTIEYSDGIVWNRMLKPKSKSIVTGYFMGNFYANGGSTPINLASVELYDSNNDYNPTNSTFLVPRTGIYTLTASVATSVNGVINSGAYWELQANPSMTSNSGGVWFVRHYGPSYTGTLQVSGSATMLLQQGETVIFQLVNFTGNNQALGTSPYNRFSIIEHQD